MSVIDQIDALVDEQLSRYPTRTGYDYNTGVQRCPHCGDEWHGLAITQRMRDMRRWRQLDPNYRYADDDSPVICPGSTFIGPVDDPYRKHGAVWRIPEDPFRPEAWQLPDVTWSLDSLPAAAPLRRDISFSIDLGSSTRVAMELYGERMQQVAEWLGSAFEDIVLGVQRFSDALDAPPSADDQTPQQRALPRPSTTPPMWAHTPQAQRRRRSHR